MPRLPEDVLKPTVYLYPTNDDAKKSKNKGGTGFLLALPFQTQLAGQPLKSHIYAVTNRHVVNNGATVIRMNQIGGGIETIDCNLEDWYPHPNGDDVTIAYLGAEIKWDAVLILSDSLLTKGIARRFNIGIGSDVFTIARLQDFRHEKEGDEPEATNSPIARFGHIAKFDSVPIFNDKMKIKQETILVEAYAIQGHSGAPVYVAEGGIGESGIWLLGVCWGYLWEKSAVHDNSGNPPTEGDVQHIRENINLMCVVPAWQLQRLLDDKDVKIDRDENERKILEADQNNIQKSP